MIKTEKKQSFKSIFSPGTRSEREENFKSYWEYIKNRDGQIFEEEKSLEKKQKHLEEFQENQVRSQKTLPEPELFYRNCLHLKEDPSEFDKKTLLFLCIYKFARHEWVGVSAAWDIIPSIKNAKKNTDKISRYHLCEEFSHVRLFHEMFETFHLDKIEWIPLGKFTQQFYKIFPRIPGLFMDPVAFVSELIGMSFYIHVDRLLDSIFEDEPKARDRIRELLHEIMIDEISHIGQRRNFLGKYATKASYRMVSPLTKIFFLDIPESKYLLDIDQMIQDGLNFNYSIISPSLIKESWIPSYLKKTKEE